MTKEKDKTEESSKQVAENAHITINKSFFSLPDREKRIILAQMLGFTSQTLAEMEGVISQSPIIEKPSSVDGK